MKKLSIKEYMKEYGNKKRQKKAKQDIQDYMEEYSKTSTSPVIRKYQEEYKLKKSKLNPKTKTIPKSITKKTTLQTKLQELKPPIVDKSPKKKPTLSRILHRVRKKPIQNEETLDKQIQQLEQEQHPKYRLPHIDKSLLQKGYSATKRGIGASVAGVRKLQEMGEQREQKQIESLRKQITKLELQAQLQRDRRALLQQRNELIREQRSRRYGDNYRYVPKVVDTDSSTSRKRARRRIRV